MLLFRNHQIRLSGKTCPSFEAQPRSSSTDLARRICAEPRTAILTLFLSCFKVKTWRSSLPVRVLLGLQEEALKHTLECSLFPRLLTSRPTLIDRHSSTSSGSAEAEYTLTTLERKRQTNVATMETRLSLTVRLQGSFECSLQYSDCTKCFWGCSMLIFMVKSRYINIPFVPWILWVSRKIRQNPPINSGE